MTLDTLKIIKATAIYAVEIGVLLLGLIVLSTLYRICFRPAKIKNKKRFDLKIYFFLKKYHPKIGMWAIILILYHAVIMSFYLIVRGKNFFPYFGFLALICFLIIGISGILLYYKMRMSNVSMQEKKRFKILHLFFVALGILFFFMHLYELRHPLVTAVDAFQSKKTQPEIPITTPK